MSLDVDELIVGHDGVPVAGPIGMSARRGRIVAIVGPNGAGKTTFIETVIGLIPACAGAVRLNGQPILQSRPFQRARMGMAWVPEGRRVFADLTVRENLLAAATDSRSGHALERASEFFPELGERMEQTAGTLSGGEQQMLALARALVTDPSVLLLDEPSLGLAPVIVERMWRFVGDITAQEQLAIVVVEQSLEIARQHANELYIVAGGESHYFQHPYRHSMAELTQIYMQSNGA